MAWQLIYTSAPRLLEAGRTGFGTVARHRAVSGMLASTVERFSQFARLPGHDPRRVVHTYRVLTVAGASYHVFTRLKDAGSDYTGRTNHLAQHVIADAREIRTLAASGLTPADVLLAIPWRESWTEGPRFLDPSEEIDLSNFGPSASSAWAAISGNPASARLLGTPQALKGCYLILPPDTRALELFREAMIEAPQGGWQTSFTTSLEPNDEVGDFRWIGLPFDSPLRTQAEVSNRLLLDLTQPAKLPAPPEPPAKAPLPEPERVAPVTMHTPAEIRSPKKVSLGHPSAQPPPATQMGNWSPEPLRTTTKKKSKSLLLAFVAVSVMSASMAGFFMWQHFTATKEHAAFQDQIKQVWGKHGLVLKNTRKSLGDEPDLEKGRALLRSLDAYVLGILQVLKNADLKGQPPTPEDTQNLPDFEGLRNAFDTWRQIHGEASASSATKASELLQSYEEWLEKRAKSWANLSDQIRKIGSLPDVDQGTRAKFVNDARELLRKTPPDKLDRSTWERLNERLGTDSEITEWLRIWSGLDGGGKIQIAETAQTNRLLPEWLKAEARKVLERDKALAEKNEAEQKAMQNKPAGSTLKAKVEDADSLDAKHPIYVAFLKDGETSITINGANELPLEQDMRIYVGGAWDKHASPDGTSKSPTGDLQLYQEYEGKYYKNKFNTKNENFGFASTGKEIKLSADLLGSGNGCRIVARSKDDSRVLFDLRIVSGVSTLAKPLLWQTVTATSLNDGNVKLYGFGPILKRLKGWANRPPMYRLRLEGAASEQVVYNIKAADENSYTVEVPAEANPEISMIPPLKKKIEELKKGIEKDDDDLKKNDQSKSPEKIKSANHDRYTEAKTKKETELKTKEAELESLQRQKPKRFELKPGSYMLLETNTEVCRVDVVSQPANSTSPSKLP